MEEEQQKTKANLYKLTRIIELQPFAGGQVLSYGSSYGSSYHYYSNYLHNCKF